MSKDFVKQKVGSIALDKARRQQEQLSYFTESSIQEDITIEYLEQYADRNIQTNDLFLTWVKNVFKQQNFLAFYKYHRFPAVSAQLINDDIKPQLARVFYSDDAFFRYTINGEQVEEPEEIDSKTFNDQIFKSLLFNHNDIIITDLKDVNTPFSHIVSIEKVVAIDSHDSIINRIAFQAQAEIVNKLGDLELKEGFLYIDDKAYILYATDYTIIKEVPHDLGRCPADYISSEGFSDNDPVRKSVFTYSRVPLEEYLFFNTLQKMTDPNGVIPIATVLDTKKKGGQPQDQKGLVGEPNINNMIGSQHADLNKVVNGSNSGGDLQAGTIIKIPPIKKEGGGFDMDIVQNYIKFFHAPIEALEYINKRIEEIKHNILNALIGVIPNQNNTTRNELDVRSGFVSAEDKLRSLSLQLSRVRQRTDYNKLALKFGPDAVTNEAFYGSDFFLQSDEQLYEMFKNAPNPIERRNTLVKLSKSRNKFNKEKSSRESILYSLLPYVSDADFNTSIDSEMVIPEIFQLQTRFSYWIGVFEATYGDILVFWNSNDNASDSEKLVLINNLIINIIMATLPTQPPQTEGE